MHTGQAEYVERGAAIGYDLVAHPEALLIPDIGSRASCSYWQSRGLNALADQGDQEAVSRRVNGGTIGLHERMAYVHLALEALA